MPFGLGVGEILLILVFLLLVFGAKRLPELGAALGKGIREFRGSLREIESELTRPPEPPRELRQPPAAPPPAATAPPAGAAADAGEPPKQQ
jgi:sec-independent protein translocase protein TatA